MQNNLVTRCRACGSQALTPAFSLGGDNTYVLCDQDKDGTACGLLQRALAAPAPAMAAETVSRTRRHRLRSVATQAMEMITTRDGKALDIGCGDSTFQSFLPRWIEGFGIDQFEATEKNRAAGKYVQGLFPDRKALNSLKKHTGTDCFDVISAISVFGQQQEPKEFLQAVARLLASDGVAVIETPYAPLSLMRNNIGAFGPDAQACHTLTSMENLARAAGLKIVRGMMSETDGGALRLFLTHQAYTGHDYVPWLEQLARFWDEEHALALGSRQAYQTFTHRISAMRNRTDAFLRELTRHSEHIHVLGTGDDMQSLLGFFELDGETVSAAIAGGPEKSGGELSLGRSSVEIISEKESRLAPPDYYLAPAAIRREVLEHWRDMIFDGVPVIFLTPSLEVVDDSNYGAELGKALAVTDGPGSVETLKAVLSAVRQPRLVAVNGRLEA